MRVAFGDRAQQGIPVRNRFVAGQTKGSRDAPGRGDSLLHEESPILAVPLADARGSVRSTSYGTATCRSTVRKRLQLRYGVYAVVVEGALDTKGLEAVADSENCLDVLLAVSAELLAKAADVH